MGKARYIIGKRVKRAIHSQFCSIEIGDIYVYIILEEWYPLKSEWGHSLYFSSSLALFSSLLSCSFYLLDQRAISGVDLLEMTWKDGIVVLCPYHNVCSQQMFFSNKTFTDGPS